MGESEESKKGNIAAAPESTADDLRPRLTATEYLRELRHISGEVLDAIAVFHTYEEINRLALADEAVYHALNRDADFWTVTVHCLQTTLFITLARIFDTAPEVHSIHRFVNTTLAQPELFSKDVFRARRIAMNGGKGADWLESFVDGAWVPSGSGDLRHLKKQLARYTKKFEEVYLPIRHTFIAHRAVSENEVSQLFERTNRAELGEILDFLHDVTDAIWDLYNNGREPVLGIRSNLYKQTNRHASDSAKRLISKLVAPTRD